MSTLPAPEPAAAGERRAVLARGLVLARGSVLLAGAASLLLLVERGGLPFYWVPLVIGLTYLAAAAASRSRGPLWAPGCVLSSVGLTEALWFADGRPADSFELAQLTLLAAGTGALLAVALRPLGVQVAPSSLAMAVLLTGAFNLAQARDVPGVTGNPWLYAGLLAAWGLPALLLHGRRRQR